MYEGVIAYYGSEAA